MKVAIKEAVSNAVAQENIPSVTVPTNVSVKVSFDSEGHASLTEAVGAAVKLSTIVQERKHWETNAYRTSNQQLYGILSQCYAFYHAMGQSNDSAKALRAELKTFCETNAIKCKSGTHGIVKVVKCVFFDDTQSIDRSRISTYSLALRCALDKKIAVDDLAAFIEKHGGVQELRRSKTPNSLSPVDRAERARTAIQTAVALTSIRDEEVSKRIDVTDYDQALLAIFVMRASGEFEIHGVVKNKVAIKAALIAYHNESSLGNSAAASA